MPDLESVNYTLALLGLASIAIGVWRSKTRKRAAATFDAILGQEPVTDRKGDIMRPGRPGLVHRVTTLEEGFAQLANQEVRIARLENDVAAIKDDKLERMLTKAESVSVWQAVAAADKATGPDPDEIDQA